MKKVSLLKKSRFKKFFLWISSFILIAVLVLWLFGYIPSRFLILKGKIFPQKPSYLEFSFNRCDSYGVPDFDPKIDEKMWLDENTYLIKVTIPGNCGDIYWFGNYEIQDNNLYLKYKVISELLMSCGNCPVELFYEIKNIPQKDYQVLVEEE